MSKKPKSKTVKDFIFKNPPHLTAAGIAALANGPISASKGQNWPLAAPP
jgi:hypothetical protein